MKLSKLSDHITLKILKMTLSISTRLRDWSKQKLLNYLLKTPEGRAKLAASMINPIRKAMNDAN